MNDEISIVAKKTTEIPDKLKVNSVLKWILVSLWYKFMCKKNYMNSNSCMIFSYWA